MVVICGAHKSKQRKAASALDVRLTVRRENAMELALGPAGRHDVGNKARFTVLGAHRVEMDAGEDDVDDGVHSVSGAPVAKHVDGPRQERLRRPPRVLPLCQWIQARQVLC